MLEVIIKSLVARLIVGLFVAFLAIFLYTFLHEGGHALAVLLSGGRLTTFDVNFITGSPHISYEGIVSSSARAFIAISGPLFPFLIWLGSLVIVRRLRTVAARTIYLFVALLAILPLLAQVVIPILHMLGVYLPREDIVGFIWQTGVHPLIVSGFFSITVVLSAVGIYKLLRPQELLKELRFTHRPNLKELKLTALVCVLAMVALVPMMSRITSGPHSRPPAEYDTRLQVGFANNHNEWTTLHEFTVIEPTVYDFVYSLNVKAPTSIRLVTDNPAGIIHTGKDYIVLCETETSRSNAQFTGYSLLEGNYRLEVRTQDKKGKLDLYVSTRDITPIHAYYLSLLQELNQGTFDLDTYQEEGYELVYRGTLKPCQGELLYSLVNTNKVYISAFVSGDFDDFALTYADESGHYPVLTNSRATMGFGITPRSSQGQLLLSSTASSGELYVYIKR